MDTGLLQNTVLFSRIKEDDIETALKELNAAEKRYKKGSVILHAGRTTYQRTKIWLCQDGAFTSRPNQFVAASCHI